MNISRQKYAQQSNRRYDAVRNVGKTKRNKKTNTPGAPGPATFYWEEQTAVANKTTSDETEMASKTKYEPSYEYKIM